MGDPIVVDVFSATTVPLEMLVNNTSLSIGTGFIWHSNDIFYLITNWHNVTGRDSVTGANLSPKGGWPDKLKLHMNAKGRLGHKFWEIFDLCDKDGRPNWLIHPSLGSKVDVVALPLWPKAQPDWYAINQLTMLDLAATVGQDIYILGYPFGIGPSGYPIWKRASIASEPEVLTQEQPYILVDTASRPGMSGSPVIRRTWGNHALANGGLLTTPGAMTKFIGVYSGRLRTTDPLDAQLGLVWPAYLIDEILVGGLRDS